MDIVIEIDNEHYERIMRFEDGVTVYPTTLALYEAVKNGTPLPKGHGRLIDADVLGEKLHRYSEAPYQYAIAVFNESPTIIEADKEG